MRGGKCPVIPLVQAEVIEDTKDFFQIEGLYSLFSAVERFLELFWFDRFLAATAAQEAHLSVCLCVRASVT